MTIGYQSNYPIGFFCIIRFLMHNIQYIYFFSMLTQVYYGVVASTGFGYPLFHKLGYLKPVCYEFLFIIFLFGLPNTMLAITSMYIKLFIYS